MPLLSHSWESFDGTDQVSLLEEVSQSVVLNLPDSSLYTAAHLLPKSYF